MNSLPCQNNDQIIREYALLGMHLYSGLILHFRHCPDIILINCDPIQPLPPLEVQNFNLFKDTRRDPLAIMCLGRFAAQSAKDAVFFMRNQLRSN